MDNDPEREFLDSIQLIAHALRLLGERHPHTPTKPDCRRCAALREALDYLEQLIPGETSENLEIPF